MPLDTTLLICRMLGAQDHRRGPRHEEDRHRRVEHRGLPADLGRRRWEARSTSTASPWECRASRSKRTPSRVLGEDEQVQALRSRQARRPPGRGRARPPRRESRRTSRARRSSLGRAMRSTGRVARGLGTIRQDLNVSVMGGGVVEVKGVQKLNLVAKVVQIRGHKADGAPQDSRRDQEERGILEVELQRPRRYVRYSVSTSVGDHQEGGGGRRPV